MKMSDPDQVGFSANRLKRIDTAMQRYVDQKKLAGIVTLVARRGSVVHFEKFGHQDLATSKPIELDTIFRIYSMTKPITSVALMMLYERALFHLTDPVSKFIPEFKKVKVFVSEGELADLEREITIQDLLRHTAGLSYGGYKETQIPVDKLYDQAEIWVPDITNQEMVRRIAALPLAYQPGQKWWYSAATDVVGYLVEVLSGMSLGAFFAEKIFEPLGMQDTAFTVPPDKVDRFATLYGLTDKGPLEVIDVATGGDYFNTRLEYGGAGLVSTAADYARFAQLVLNKGELDGVRLLGPRTVDLMTADHLPSSLLPRQYVKFCVKSQVRLLGIHTDVLES
jgi:CubicO group peptidase (beta-lactamase class C family)